MTLVVDAADADAIGDEPVWHDGKVVGWITSGGYGHCVGKSIALGYVPARSRRVGAASRSRSSASGARATLAEQALYDPARRADAGWLKGFT